MMKNTHKLYIAIPYTNVVRGVSFMTANRLASALMKAGYIVFSPISHGHAISNENELPVDWEFWKKSCLSFIMWADVLVVIMLDGWKESIGVAEEICVAKKLGKKIIFVMPGGTIINTLKLLNRRLKQ